MSFAVLEVRIRKELCKVIRTEVPDSEYFECYGTAHLLVSLACLDRISPTNIFDIVKLYPPDLVGPLLKVGSGYQKWVEKMEFQRVCEENGGGERITASRSKEECKVLRWPIHSVLSLRILGPSSIEFANWRVERGNFYATLVGFPPGVESVQVEGRFTTYVIWGFWRIYTPEIEVQVE